MPNTRDGFKLLPTSIGEPRGEDGGRGDPALRPQHGLPHQGAHQGRILIDIIMDKGVLGLLGTGGLHNLTLCVTLCYSVLLIRMEKKRVLVTGEPRRRFWQNYLCAFTW